MHEKIYTHISIYDNEKYVGTFSENTLLSWLVDNIIQGQADFRKLRISYINKKYLNSPNDKVEFISADLDIFEIKKIFDNAINRRKRLGALLITPTGRKDYFPPIGIITAYDLLKIDEYLK